jgi:hypothetical protein
MNVRTAIAQEGGAGGFDFEAALASGVSFRDVIVPYLPNPELTQVG